MLYFVILLALNFLVYFRWFKEDVLSSSDFTFHFHNTIKEWYTIPQIWYTQLETGNYNLQSLTPAPYYNIYGIFGLLGFNSNTADKFLFYGLFVIAISTSILFFRAILSKPIPAFIAAIIYCFNTYILLLTTGHMTLAVAYSLVPLFLYLAYKLIKTGNLIYIPLISLIGFVIGNYDFRILYLIFFIYLSYGLILAEKSTFKNNIVLFIKYLIPFAFIFLLNLFWILPLVIVAQFQDGTNILERGIFGNNFLDLNYALTLHHPFWTGTKPAIFETQKIPLYMWIIPVIALLGLITNRKNRQVLFFGAITIIGILLTKQSGTPFPNLYLWLYNNFPGFNAYREASKFFLFIALGYSILIGSFINWLWTNENKKAINKVTKYGITIAILFIFILNTKPIFTGDIDTLFTPRFIPKDYLILKNFITDQDEYFRVLWTPKKSRWGLYTSKNPAVSFVSTDWHCSQNTSCTSIIEKEINDDYLDSASIKYMVLPLSDIENDDNTYLYYGVDRKDYIKALDDLEYLNRIDIGTDDILVYENKSFKPHIYNIDELETSWMMKSPTEYIVSIENINKSITLIFNESYHPGWVIIPPETKWYSLFFKNYSNSYSHTKSDFGYNEFKLEENVISEIQDDHNTNVNKHSNLKIYFKPQIYVNLGFIFSAISFVLLISWVFIFSIRSIYRKKT